MKIDFETQLYRNSGLDTRLTVQSYDYDVIEVVISQKMLDENGKVIVDSRKQLFFTEREFKDFFEPFVNEMKVRFENANSIQE